MSLFEKLIIMQCTLQKKMPQKRQHLTQQVEESKTNKSNKEKLELCYSCGKKDFLFRALQVSPSTQKYYWIKHSSMHVWKRNIWQKMCPSQFLLHLSTDRVSKTEQEGRLFPLAPCSYSLWDKCITDYENNGAWFSIRKKSVFKYWKHILEQIKALQ